MTTIRIVTNEAIHYAECDCAKCLGQNTIPHNKIFGDNHQIVFVGNKQIYMVDLAKNTFPSLSFFCLAKDGDRPRQKYVCKYIKIKSAQL
jgi:hypothetical protein